MAVEITSAAQLHALLGGCDLAALLAPVSIETFLEQYWDRQPLHLNGGPETAIVAGAFDGLSPGEIVEVCGGEFWYRTPGRDVHAVVGTDDVHVRKAVWTLADALHAKGTTVYVPLGMRGLATAADQLLRALGRRQDSYDCSLFVVPDGGGAPAHIDASSSLTLQLSGTKRWLLAPSPSASAPVTPTWILGDPEPEDHRWSTSGPVEPPKQWPVDVTLAPGDVLYTPRGWIHKTSSSGSSTALNLNLDEATWAAPLLDVCRALVLRGDFNREVWRHAEEFESPARIATSLRELGNELRVVVPADLASPPTGDRSSLEPGDVVRRNPLVSVRWTIAGEDVHVYAAHPLRDDLTVTIPSRLVGLLEAARRFKGSTTVGEMVGAVDDERDALGFASLLVDLGVLLPDARDGTT